MKDIENKVALITGAASGIGRAIATLFSENGAKVVVSDIDEVGGNETVSIISKTGGEATFIKANTSIPKDQEKLVNQTLKKYGALHIACNNAGIGGPAMPVGEYTIEGWDNVISINLNGVFYGMRYQLPALLASGGGSIINMSSILGLVGFANSAAYVAAKHGIIGLTQSSALEYSSKNIRVNCICPGFIKTPLLDKLVADTIKFLETKHPIGRLGKAEEVAELALWLASSKSSFVSGSNYTVDGGYTAQ